MSTPSISVVVPVYNGAELVGRAINSVLAQTFADWELIAVDDGSSDGTPGVLASFVAADSRVRVITHRPNRGLSAARNSAMRSARGEWIAYLDHDDEYYPGYLAGLWDSRRAGDVLVCQYDLVEERRGLAGAGQVRRHDPGKYAQAVYSDHIAVPLGVSHRRSLLDAAGYFDESLARYEGQDEDADLWRRFARSGAKFAYLPTVSGLYHVRAESVSRTRPLAPAPQPRARRADRPRVLFASYHSHLDPSSGAAVSVRDLFDQLSSRGWHCGAVTGPLLDDPAARPLGDRLAAEPGLGVTRGRAGGTDFALYEGASFGFTWTSYSPSSADRQSAESVAGYLASLERSVGRFRPDVVLTYGGDSANAGIVRVARRARARVAFWLHNFAYRHRGAFAGCDAVVVPSEFSRRHYKTELGVDAVAIPPVLSLPRVVAPDRDPKYLTFVNPDPAKGVFFLARLAEVLARERPDIPMLVVEGRGRVNWLGRCGVDLRPARSLSMMANTSDPRSFHRVTKVMLVPSVWRESFGRVAAEAILNGASVVASDRGALPEVVGEAGACLSLPAWLTPDSRVPPTTEEVRPWVEAVEKYMSEPVPSVVVRPSWHPESVLTQWEEFLDDLDAGRAGLGPSS